MRSSLHSAAYDWALILRQLGVFREPTTRAGRLAIALLHPVTLTRAYTRFGRDSRSTRT